MVLILQMNSNISKATERSLSSIVKDPKSSSKFNIFFKIFFNNLLELEIWPRGINKILKCSYGSDNPVKPLCCLIKQREKLLWLKRLPPNAPEREREREKTHFNCINQSIEDCW